MNTASNNYFHLSPRYNRHGRRPSSDRRSSASYTDGMSNMQRQLSSSSYATGSSQTTHYIHSNIGDSISPTHHVVPSYPHDYSNAFNWNDSGQVQAEDENVFDNDDYSLFPSVTAPQLTVSAYAENLNIESGVDDPDALLERLFNNIRQTYNAQTDRLAYVQDLFQRCLGVDSIRVPPEQTSRNSGLDSQPATTAQRKEQYRCLLCVTHRRVCSRGTFKRHVGEMHKPKSIFLCMHCEWSHSRKDKLIEHLRTRHLENGRHTPQEIRDQEVILPVPHACDLCISYRSLAHKSPFESWDSWFNCIAEHCILKAGEEDQPKSESRPPDQNGGNAGGAGGGYLSTSPFPQGLSPDGASFSQVDSWFSAAGSSPWSFNGQTRSGSQTSCDNPERPMYESNTKPSTELSPNDRYLKLLLHHSKDASILSPKQSVTKLNPEPFWKMGSSAKENSVISMLTEQLSRLYLDYKPKPTAKLRGTKPLLSTRDEAEITEKVILRKSLLISNITQKLYQSSPVDVINKVLLHTHGRLYDNKKLDDRAKVLTVDALAAGEIILHRIYYDQTISREIVPRHITQRHASMNAIQMELSDSSVTSDTSMRQLRNRKRLSSLLTRLRAITFMLSLQKEAANEEIPKAQPSIVSGQLNIVKLGRKATTSPTVNSIRFLYDFVQNYCSEPIETSTKGGGLTCIPTREYPLGASDLSELFLQSLTSSISMPKISLMDSYENIDSYGRHLHHYISNIHTSSF